MQAGHWVSEHLKDLHPYPGHEPRDPTFPSTSYGKDGVPKLIRILGESDLSLEKKQTALKVWFNMMSEQEKKIVAINNHGVQVLKVLLNDDDSMVRCYSARILSSLAMIMQGRTEIFKLGCLPVLSELLSDEYSEVRESVTEAFLNTSLSYDGRAGLVKVGGLQSVQALVKVLADPVPEIVVLSVQALFNIAALDGGILLSLDAGIMPHLVSLLDQNACLEDTLNCLTHVSQHPEGKVAAIKDGAVAQLAVCLLSDDMTVVRLSMVALKSVCINSDGKRLAMAKAVPNLCALLHTELKELAVQTLVNIAEWPAARKQTLEILSEQPVLQSEMQAQYKKYLASHMFQDL